MTVRTGISGWRYPPWRGAFYPKGLPQRHELAYAAQCFGSVEINGTFYSLQLPSSFLTWAGAVPDDFKFAVKGPRFVTHMKKLRDVDVPMANFFASGVLGLGHKLGPLLWQLPPQLPFDSRLAEFLTQLPRTSSDAADLALGHDERMAGRASTTVGVDQPLQHAVEFRHPSYVDHLDVFAEHGVAVVVADTAGKWPLVLEQTSPTLSYVRLHGDQELYVSGYSGSALDIWAARIQGWQAGRDIYVYFDNDVKVRAPVDARALAEKLGVGPVTA